MGLNVRDQVTHSSKSFCSSVDFFCFGGCAKVYPIIDYHL